LPDYIFPLVQL
jgi:hypothetical protein